MKLRNWLPRSLSTRMVLLTLGTILLVQAATFASVSYYRKKYTEEVTVVFTATTIRTLRAALAEIPSVQRDEFVRQASQNQWHLWSRTLPSNNSLAHRRPPRNPAPPPPAATRHYPPTLVQALTLRLPEHRTSIMY